MHRKPPASCLACEAAELRSEGSAAGAEGQKLILGMVAAGRLTAEEGVRLLEALAGRIPPAPGKARGITLPHGRRVDDAFAAGDWQKGGITGGTCRAGVFQGEEPWQVKVDVPNGRLQLIGTAGPGWQATITTRGRAWGWGIARGEAGSEDVGARREEQWVRVDSGDRYLHICCPRRVFGGGWVTDVGLRLPPGIYDVRGVTTNGNIEVRDLRCREIRLRTANGRIGVEEVRAEEVELRTANGAITAEIAARRLLATTVNGTVCVRSLAVELDSYRLSSSQGSIRVNCGDKEAGYRVNASSSWGKVEIDLPGLKEVSHRCGPAHRAVCAATPGFDTRVRQLLIDAHTGSGGIVITGEGADE